MDMIGPLFFFVSFWLYLKASSTWKVKAPSTFQVYYAAPGVMRTFSVIFAALAFFSYELTLVLPLLIVLYDFCFKSPPRGSQEPFGFAQDKSFGFAQDKPSGVTQGRPTPEVIEIRHLRGVLSNRLVLYLPYFLAVAFYFSIRFFVIGRYPGGTNYWIGPGIYDWSRLMTPEIVLKYLKLLAIPSDLSFSHIIRPGFETFLAWVNDPAIFNNYSLLPSLGAAIAILILLFLIFKIRKSQPLLVFSVFWFFIALLPFANIVSQPALLAERYLYIASFGFVLGLSYLSHLSYLRFSRSLSMLFPA